MTLLSILPNEVLELIISLLDPFSDFEALVSVPLFKPIIDHTICVLSDSMKEDEDSKLPVRHISTYNDSIKKYKHFIIRLHSNLADASLPTIIGTMIQNAKTHKIHIMEGGCIRNIFNEAVFKGNSYTKGFDIPNVLSLGDSYSYEKFYILLDFKIQAPNLKYLRADFHNKKSFLRNFNAPNLYSLSIKSSHLSAACIRDFRKLRKLCIHSFADFESLNLPELHTLYLGPGYSLMLNNCQFPKLKHLLIDDDARLPGIVDCELDSLEQLIVSASKTSFIKNIKCWNLKTLNLLHTVRGVLNTMVLENGKFPKLENLSIPSPGYLVGLGYNNSLKNIRYLTVFVQKKWFHTTMTTEFSEDEESEESEESQSISSDDETYEMTIERELQILAEAKLPNVVSLELVIEDFSKFDGSVLKIPDFSESMPNLRAFTFLANNDYTNPLEEIYFDLTSWNTDDKFDSFLTNIRTAHLYCTNSALLDSYSFVTYFDEDDALMLDATGI